MNTGGVNIYKKSDEYDIKNVIMFRVYLLSVE